MKQTNNAIKFLLAQYRAIFKQAYLKGLVSAVILTTGLAAGATNAKEIVGTGGLDDSTQISEKITDTTNTWVGKLTISNSGSSDNIIYASGTSASINAAGANAGSLSITGDSKGLTFSGSADGSLSVYLEEVSVSTSGELVIDGSANTTLLNTNTLTLDNNATVKLSGSAADKVASLEADTISLSSSGTLALSGNSSVNTNTLTVTDGIITSDTAANTITVGSANFTNGSLTVTNALALNVAKAAEPTAEEQTADVVFNGTAITTTEALTLSGGTFDFTKAGAMSGAGGTVIEADATAQFTDAKLAAYLETSSAKGAVVVKNGGFLELTDSLTIGNGIALDSGSTATSGTISADASATIITPVLNLSGGATNEVKAAINVDTLNFNYSGTDSKISNVTVAKSLINKHSADVTLSNSFKLYAAEGSSGTISAGDDNKGFIIGASENAPDIKGNWDLATTLSVSGSASDAVVFNLNDGAVLDVVKGGTLSADKLGTINVNAGAELNIAAGGTLKVAGTADGAVQVVVNSGSLTFAEGSTVNIASGNLTVKNTTVDLTTADTVTTGASGSIIADQGANITIDNDLLTTKTAITAQNGGALSATNLKVADANFSGDAITINADGTLKVDNLTVTDELKSSSLAGTILVNKTLQGAEKDASVVISAGTLQLGADDAAKGSIKSDLTVANTTNVFGTWTGKGLTVSGSGKLNVGSVDAKNDTVVGGNLTADTIKVADNGKITVNQDSVLLVKGDSGETATADESIGKDGYYGFSLTDKTVNVNGGTFTIGANAVAGLQDTEVEEDINASGSSTDFNYIRDNFGTYDLTGNGTLKIEFAEGDNLTKEEYLQLKKELLAPVVGDDGILTSGKLDIGGAEIEGLTTGEGSIIQNGSISFDTYQQFKDELAGLDTNEITSAKLTDANGTVESLNIGSIQLAKGGSISFTGDNSLNTASNGNLIADVNGKAADGTVESGASLSLNGNGAVNDIVLQEGEAEDYTTLNINASNKLNSIAAADTAYTKVVVGASGEATVADGIAVAELENNNKLTVTSGNVTTNKFTNKGTASIASGSLETDELTNTGVLSVKNVVNTGKFADSAESTLSAKSVTITADDADSISTVAGTVTATESFTLNGFDIENRAKVAGKIIADKGTVNLNNADVAETGIVSAKNANLSGDIAVDGEFVVSDKTIIADAALVNLLHDASLGDVVLNAYTGDHPDNDVPGFSVENGALVVAKTITGAAGNEIAVGVDEAFEGKSATGYLEVSDQLDLSGAKLVTEPNYQEKAALVAVNRLSGKKDNETLGLLNGSVFVGQNSAVGFGVTLAELQSKMSQFLVDGAFQDPSTNDGSSYGAVMYLDKPLSISSNYGIVLTADSYDDAKAATVDTASGTIYFGDNTALAVNTDTAKTGEAYIKFVTETPTSEQQSLATASVEPRKTTTTNSGTLIAAGGDIVLFGDTYRKSYQLFDSNIAIKGDDEAESGEITVISANGFLVGTLNNDSKGAVSLGINEEKAGVFLANASSPVQSSLIAYIRGYNGEAEEITTEGESDTNGTAKAAADTPTTIIPGVADGNLLFTYDKNGKKIYDYNNYFLSQVVLGGNAADAEKVSRLGVYGGTAQAALTAGATTYEAVAGRMGVGAQNGNITFADNGQGAGLWVTPVYKNHDSDGFGAQGLTYGADLDLYGVALGADYTLENGLRVGAAFNVGSGDADGQGAGAGVSNDFDYYGFTVYGGFTMDQLSVVADVSYTAVDNDVEANTGVEKVSASMDSTNLSFGVTAQYAFNMNGVSVTPHAGLRYTNIDLDDYTVRGSADIAKYSADSASVFSIPVGVTFAKEITSGAWTIKPALDLTLTANMGDDSVDGSVTWAGVENLKTNLESEVIDSFTYGAALGVSAKSGNMSFGFGVNYTGASSADEYGVSANARFVF